MQNQDKILNGGCYVNIEQPNVNEQKKNKETRDATNGGLDDGGWSVERP